MKRIEIINGVEVLPPANKQHWEILSAPAMRFFAELHREFNPQRLQLLQQRVLRQHKLECGFMPDFLPETRAVREGFWQVAPVPEDLQDRRVEITGPVDRKTIINALNS
ncbi:MAG: malate synthase A, partial [Limisphaerales bacterium]